MFDRIAWRYDLLNSVLTFGLDRYWRRAALRVAHAVVNLAAANSVDACKANPTWAYEGNFLGPLRLARVVRDVCAAFVHFSTDFAHGGLADPAGYLAENTQAVPINTYGHSKLMGEEAVAAVGGRHYVLARHGWSVIVSAVTFAQPSKR